APGRGVPSPRPRPGLRAPVAAVVYAPLQWVFDRSAAAGIDEGQLLSISLSAATEEIGTQQDELVRQMYEALGDVLPETRQAALAGAVVTREPRATFRAVPGSARLRPSARTALRGLALAGAWTDTGWPATREGAVRGGRAAAAVVLAESPARARRGERSAAA